MTTRYLVKEAHEATWARRVALFFLQLLIFTVILHHFASLTTPAAMNLLRVSVIGLTIAVLIAVGAIVRIWIGGEIGASQAVAAILIAAVGLAAPAWFAAQYFMLPQLTAIETTPSEPLEFKMLTKTRPADANPIENLDEIGTEEQQEAYPDIRPMALERSAAEVFNLVQEAVRRLGWAVAISEPPGNDGVGRIEATDRTLIMGFTDDVVVQVKGDDTQAKIDVRSVSRYGQHDLGTNAARVRTLFAEVKTELEKGEKTGLEPALKAKPSAKKKVTKRKPKARRRTNG
ncbi:MAG: DUF1499 domain-containing protein [Methyloceanibacter sp.]|uniref:DUF1499 domain-containing protein n=1 Tax=Methyloceanibacter sp. TaxID=1965321 RepID=UPI003D9B4CFD